MVESVSKLVTSVAVEAGKEVATAASKGFSQIINDIVYANWGYKWSEARQKKEIEVAHNVEKFRAEIQEKSDNIPEENSIEPDLYVIGSVLEAAKYRINKDEIRDAFSNLIVSTMDSSKADYVHASFPDIIKSLEPLDAKILQYLYRSGDETISKIRETFDKDGGFIDVYSHIYLTNLELQDNSLIAPSIDNLIRLGLISVDYETFKHNDELYDKHRNNPLLLEYKNEKEKIRKYNQNILDSINSNPKIVDKDTNRLLSIEEIDIIKKQIEKELTSTKIDIVKGKISLTDLGLNLCKACVS